MKYNNTIKNILLVLTAALSGGCGNLEPYGNPYDTPIDGLTKFTASLESLQTRTAMEQNGNVVWSAGDAVGVYAGTGENVKFILKETFNSTATFEAEDKVGIGDTFERLYAYYPYSDNGSAEGMVLNMKIPHVQTRVPVGFDNGICPMVSSATTRSLQFRHVCGIVKLKVSNPAFGKIKKIRLTASDKDILSGPMSVDMSVWPENPLLVMDGKSGFSDIILDCGEGVFSNSSGVFFYFVLPPKSYSFLKFEIENEEEEVFEVRKPETTVVRGQIIDAGIATVYIEESFYGKSNCIRQDAPGTYSFDVTPYYTTDSYGYAYEFNTRDDLKLAATAKLIWQSEQDMISGITLSEDKKTVTFTANKTGNSLIGLYDEEGNVIWSFHIWISPAKSVVYPNGYEVLDRNLGATESTKGSMKSWGLYYQWGRKDPFPEIKLDKEIIELKTYFDAENNEFAFTGEPSVPGNDHRYSISIPAVFIQRAAAGNTIDWVFEGGNNGLWGNPEGYKHPAINTLHKSIYDPCPEGYMVSPAELYTGNGVKEKSSVNAFYDADNQGRMMTYDGLEEWYPAARQIHHNWPKATMKANDYTGRYWISSPDKNNNWKGLSVTWGSGDAVMFPEWGQWRAFGFSVRCVRVTDGR